MFFVRLVTKALLNGRRTWLLTSVALVTIKQVRKWLATAPIIAVTETKPGESFLVKNLTVSFNQVKDRRHK